MAGPRLPRLAALVVALAPAFVADRSWAEDPTAPLPQPPPEETAPKEARVATDEDAKTLLGALDAASKKKAPEVLKALQAMEGIKHEQFLKPLTKLLKHEDGTVAVRAATLLEAQKPTGADEKTAAKEADKALREMWKAAFTQNVNDPRPQVKGAVVRVHGAWGVALDEREFDEVESLWRAAMGNPDPRRTAALGHVVAYVEAAKDKRFSRMLAEQIDEPHPADPNSASNPPASYWEARWKAWNEILPGVTSALQKLTGQTFKTTADAKKWFEANERTYGFKW